ncbi:DNA repair exonuclease [Pontibacillus sp. HMF3514]|uniref:metallophosphoesterase family protein n=1 Tax=Pontibacillus sp. HMF3514 TaxID=2692425 RepID=UPI00131F9AD6|nr:DNA repair exonuclease [Pontibacillus sp. HMF3514]QHE51331.1 DNA repair exonuclease [Pontibacillus sp. HMF3514]
MKETIKFIHSADLHLDSPFQGFFDLPEEMLAQVRDSTFQAFDRLIQQAIQHEVDFVLIVGDLFDQDGRSLKAQVRLRKAFEKLHEYGIDVFLSHGNHDHLGGSFYSVEFPDNVHIFNEETVTSIPYYKGEEKCAEIYGFSYEKRAVTEPKAEEFIPSSEDVYHIGMLHGSLATNTDHDVYAPFRIEDLYSRGLDYWALGHIHKRQQLSEYPPILYSGNIQGRHRNEDGEKGCNLVELTETGHSLQFLPTGMIRFETRSIDVNGCETLKELEQKLYDWKEELRKESAPVLLHLTLKGDIPSGGEEAPDIKEELRQIWNEQEEGQENWIWIHKLNVMKDKGMERNQLAQGSHFVGELLRTMEEVEEVEEVEEDLRELTQHHALRKYVQGFSEEEKEEITKHAEDLLLRELLKEGD